MFYLENYSTQQQHSTTQSLRKRVEDVLFSV